MNKFYVNHIKPLIVMVLFVGAVAIFAAAVSTLYGLKKYRIAQEKIKQEKIQSQKEIEKILNQQGFILHATQHPTAEDFFWAGFMF